MTFQVKCWEYLGQGSIHVFEHEILKWKIGFKKSIQV